MFSSDKDAEKDGIFINYGPFRLRVERAGGPRERGGARGGKRGDRIAILLPQSAEVAVCHFAAYKLGAVVLPLAALFGADALSYRLSDSGARAVITDACTHQQASPHCVLVGVVGLLAPVPAEGLRDGLVVLSGLLQLTAGVARLELCCLALLGVR
jgi:non-ribosomal peptide synthetase component F